MRKSEEAAVIEREGVTPEVQSVLHGDGPSTEVQYRRAWARTYLKGMGSIADEQPTRRMECGPELGQSVTEDLIAPLHAEFVATTRK